MSIFRLLIFSFFTLLAKEMAAQQPKLMLPMGHTRSIADFQISRDGKILVTNSEDASIKIWDAGTGRLLSDFKDEGKLINSINISPANDLIVASSWSGVYIYDLFLGKLTRKLTKKGSSYAEFSPDGQSIATITTNREVMIWDTRTGILKKTLTGHNAQIMSLAFSKDGKLLITSSMDSTAKIWNFSTGELKRTFKSDYNYITSAYFVDGDKRVITSSYGDVSSWDAVTGKLLSLNKGFSSVTFSPDMSRAVTIDIYGKVVCWDGKTGDSVRVLNANDEPVTLSKFSDNGEYLLTLEHYTYSNIVRKEKFQPLLNTILLKVWNSKNGELLQTISVKNIYEDITAEFYPGGKKIALSGKKEIVVYDIQSGRPVYSVKGEIDEEPYARLSEDGKGIINIKRGEMGGVGKKFSEIDPVAYNDSKVALYSPKRTMIAAVLPDSSVKVWDTYSGKLILLLPISASGSTVLKFSHDESILAVAVLGKPLELWNLQKGILISKIWDESDVKTTFAKGFSKIYFTKNNERVLTQSRNYYYAKVWDIQSGNMLFDLSDKGIEFLKFFPDQEKVVISHDLRKPIHVYDVNLGRLLDTVKVQESSVLKAFMEPDGNGLFIVMVDSSYIFKDYKLVSCMKYSGYAIDISFTAGTFLSVQNAYLNLYDWQTKKLLYSQVNTANNDHLIIDSKGRYDGTASARKILYFTCGTEVIELDQVKDQLWVPGLLDRITKGDSINAKTLDELNICGLTPEVEEAGSNAEEYHFKIKPRRGGLGETVVFINGIEAKRYKPADLKRNEGFYELIITKKEVNKYFVAGKENPVTVKAYTANNSISSRGLIINVDKTKEAVTATPNLYAVMVGVSDYKGEELDLKYAAKDANDISTVVSNAARKLLNSDGKEHVFMYNLTTASERYQLPEKNSIRKVLEEIGKKATSNDILLVFFAGHGVMEGAKKQFYFLTADASQSSAASAIADVGISTAELTEWMKPQNIKAQKRILIFDACNSGQAIKDFVNIGNTGQGYMAARNDEKGQQIKAIEKLNEQSGLFILSASASNQSAYEMGRYSQGLLTYALLKAIKQQPDILQDGKYLDISRWFNAAEKTVGELTKDNGARQQPQIVSNTNFNLGIVDEEVMAKIVLPQEKPLFTNSNLQNADENIAMDDLELNKMLDVQLSDISARGSAGTIVYSAGIKSADAWALGGRYEVNGNTITARINIRQGREIKHRFELSGSKEKLQDLAAAIAAKAAEVVK